LDALSSATTMQMHFQPIVDLETLEVLGHEALARFPTGSPERWFELAHQVGLGVELELAAIAKALTAMPALPGFMSVNASPVTLLSPELFELLDDVDATRVVVELTEHTRVDSYEEYELALDRLRRRGVRVAVDDAGAGHSSMRHIIYMAPEIIKLDRSLTIGIEHDPVRQSFTKAIVSFASSLGALIVAEGIDQEGEVGVLADIGVLAGQGWIFAKAAPLAERVGRNSEVIDLRFVDEARLASRISN
jgi:EAL domain-containing protein (putative c-di-GMP-specific phosphodiesterase class I)